MPKLDLSTIPEQRGSNYPPPHDAVCKDRLYQTLGVAGGLTQFGVNKVRLPPGAWSSQRHWHALEDEMLYVLAGEVVMVTDTGEETLRAGDCVTWKAGVRDGHCVQNRSTEEAVMLAIGSRIDEDWGEYSDIDMVFTPGRYSVGPRRRHKDGTPY